MSTLFSDQIFTVGDITFLIKKTLEESLYGISVKGEISNLKIASSGHWYFQLNDEKASLQAVIFKMRNWRIPYVPKNGDIVTVTGNISVYEKKGSYQLICDTMILSGIGDMLLLLEERKRAFAAAGFFDPSLKRALPLYPRKIGVVTSPTGAAIRDILHVLKRRNKTIDVLIFPSLVQGEQAAQQIARQIAVANRYSLVDVLIIGRGGGSMEDLLPFSEQCVIEAIVDSHIPIISAVGHEIDYALSDYAADVRAPTPSAAAELVTDNLDQLHKQTKKIYEEMEHIMVSKIAFAKSLTSFFSIHYMHEYMRRRIDSAYLQLDTIKEDMSRSILQLVHDKKHLITVIQKELNSLSPLSVLARGYSIVQREDSKEIVFSSEQVHQGDPIVIQFASGRAGATIATIET